MAVLGFNFRPSIVRPAAHAHPAVRCRHVELRRSNRRMPQPWAVRTGNNFAATAAEEIGFNRTLLMTI
jgi:hypothetical protein